MVLAERLLYQLYEAGLVLCQQPGPLGKGQSLGTVAAIKGDMTGGLIG